MSVVTVIRPGSPPRVVRVSRSATVDLSGYATDIELGAEVLAREAADALRQPLDADLTALANLSGEGYARRDGGWVLAATIPVADVAGLDGYARLAGPQTHTGTHTFTAGVTSGGAMKMPYLGEIYFNADLNQPSIHNEENSALTVWNSGSGHAFRLLKLHANSTTVISSGASSGDAIWLNTQYSMTTGVVASASICSFRVQGVQKSRVNYQGIYEPPGFAVASLPGASEQAGGFIRVTNATPANRPAYSDGTVWRWVSDDTVVS